MDQVGDVGPDDLAADGAKDELLELLVVVVDVDVHAAAAGAPARLPRRIARRSLAAHAHDHAVALLELIGPGAVERLHEADGAARLRELPRDDQQRLAVAPDDAAEGGLAQPLGELRAARVGGV